MSVRVCEGVLGDSDRPAPIETRRLLLNVLLPDEIRALIHGDTALASRLAGVVFPSDWPEDPTARKGLPWHLEHLEKDSRQRAWRIRVVVERGANVVVGSVNLKGPPDERGDVEIGWGITERRRRRGYAFEAVTAVMAWVTLEPTSKTLSATIHDDNRVSQQLAARLGFVRSDRTRRDLPLWIRPSLVAQ